MEQHPSRKEHQNERLRGAANRVLQQEESLAFDTTSVVSSESEISKNQPPAYDEPRAVNFESRADRLQERLRGAGTRRPIQESSIAFDAASITSTETYATQTTQSQRLPTLPRRQSKLAARFRGVAHREIDDISSLGIESTGLESESALTARSIDNEYEFMTYGEDDDLDVEPTVESIGGNLYQEHWLEDENMDDENSDIYDSLVAGKKRSFEHSEIPRKVVQRLKNRRRAAADSESDSDSGASAEEEQSRRTDTNEQEDVLITVEKVSSKYGGTSKINAVDVVADVIDRLLDTAVVKSKRRNVAPWAATAMADLKEEIKRRFRSLTDIVDTNRALMTAAKRSTHSRNRLRVRLLHLRRQRTEIHGEIHRIREEHRKILREKLELREISRFIGDVQRLETIPEDTSINLEAKLKRLEPMFNRHYGTVQRVRSLNTRMKELIEAYERS